MSNQLNKRTLGLCLLATALGSACATNKPEVLGIETEALTPRLTADMEVLEQTTPTQRAQLQLIATNLIATLVQIPEMRPTTATLQISTPKTAFGHAIIRALEDAGFGMQKVSADQGKNYVSYSKSVAETESGPVTDYSLAVGKIRLSREYTVEDHGVFPSSLMKISGTNSIADISLADDIFTEQGGENAAFISGAQQDGIPIPDLPVRTVDVNDYDELPQDKRTRQDLVFAEARKRFFEADAKRVAPNLNKYLKYRRTVLIFADNETQMLGAGNKNAVRLMTREFSENDLMVIKGCQDADGNDNASMNRAIRVKEELAGFGIPTESSYIAPCVRSSYRHSSDNSPTPVELIHYRPN